RSIDAQAPDDPPLPADPPPIAAGLPPTDDPSPEAIGVSALSEQATYTWWQHLSPPASGFRMMRSWIFVEHEPASRPGQAPPAYLHSYQFHFNAAGSDGGYIGLQKDSQGMRAIFSVWGATGATCSPVPGAICRPFGGEGTGYQTMVPYTWHGGSFYIFQVE